MRIRSIKPEFWQSESMSTIESFSRLMAIALLNLSDDHGYFNANPSVVRGEVFPFEESLANVSRAIAELSRVGYIKLGMTQSGKRIGKVVNFKIHQKVDHPSRLAFDVDSVVWDEKTTQVSRDPREDSPSPRASLDQEQGAGSRDIGAGSREQGKRKRNDFAPPTLEEVLAYCSEKFPDWHRSRVEAKWKYFDGSEWTKKDGSKVANWKSTFSTAYGFAKDERKLGPTPEFIRDQQQKDGQDAFLAFTRDMQEGIRRESERK